MFVNGKIVEGKYIYETEIYLFINHFRSFPTARAVFHHACSAHVKYPSDHICLWNGCDRIKRQKWALISHIQVDIDIESIIYYNYIIYLGTSLFRSCL